MMALWNRQGVEFVVSHNLAHKLVAHGGDVPLVGDDSGRIGAGHKASIEDVVLRDKVAGDIVTNNLVESPAVFGPDQVFRQNYHQLC